jgi:ribonuclease HI
MIKMPQVKRVFTNSNAILPPWEEVAKYIHLGFAEIVYNNATFQDYTERYFPSYNLLFRCGSKVNKNSGCSAASAMYVTSNKITVCWKLRAEHSVLSTELYALWQALIYVKINNYNDTIIFTDSLSSLQLIESVHKTYTNIVGEIQKLLLDLNQDRIVLLHWVRGHTGIIGNEIADKAPNKGHENNRTELYDLTRDECISILKQKFRTYWNEYWILETDRTSKGLYLWGIRDNIAGSMYTCWTVEMQAT